MCPPVQTLPVLIAVRVSSVSGHSLTATIQERISEHHKERNSQPSHRNAGELEKKVLQGDIDRGFLAGRQSPSRPSVCRGLVISVASVE